MKWSLAPTRRLLDALGHPEVHFDAVHVGGTNGKGSVAALLYEAFRADGRRVGLYTSPHLVDVRERMIVDEQPIAPDAFAMWTDQLRAEIVVAEASFFEATTAIAFADFAARGVEIGVIEVGLGGRLDSTNVLDPLVSGVTYVGLEHTEYLGNSLEEIAREKAGIAKPGRPFVIGEPDPDRAGLMERIAIDAGARPVRVPPDAVYGGRLALRGHHQRRNAAVAEAMLAVLPDGTRPPREAVERGFARTAVRGRFERRGKWIFDVAHNADGIATLIQLLEEDRPARPLHALVAVLSDKDWRRMVDLLLGEVDQVWATVAPTSPPARRWDLSAVERHVGTRARVESDFDTALAGVQQGAATVLVCGSFHTVGDAMARLPGFAPLG